MGIFTTTVSSSPVDANIQGKAKRNLGYYAKRVGVSVLFSGAAVGVSHVVQATRAGGEFSLGVIPVLLICLLLKYPAFLFGPLYTRVTQESVVAGYARVGAWTLPLVAFVFASIMFTVVAAVSMLAAGILVQMLPFTSEISVAVGAVSLVLISTTLSVYTSFSKFQNSMKAVFVLLVVMSVLALVLALPQVEAERVSWSFPLLSLEHSQVFFVAALIGWMPAGLDLPMMHSQWLLAQTKRSQDNTIEDFNFGYLSTTVLALVFVLIGAVFFYGDNITIDATAGGFSKQLLGVYTHSLGTTAGRLMGFTFFLAIFSTLYVVVDGFPRVLSEVLSRLFIRSEARVINYTERYRKISAWIQAMGAVVIVFYLSKSLHQLVDFATVVSFLVGPVFALLNHRLVALKVFREKASVSLFLRAWSFLGISFFVTFAAYYLIIKFFI